MRRIRSKKTDTPPLMAGTALMVAALVAIGVPVEQA
jgi:hypothetical protein